MNRLSNFYYIEDLVLKRYYSLFEGKKFKTEADYIKYLKDNNKKIEKLSIPRKSRFSIIADPIPLVENVEFLGAKGTIFFDERDYSMYQFNNIKEIAEFFDGLERYPDRYRQQCLYTGYPGDEKDSIESIIKYWEKTYTNPKFNKDKENKVFAHFLISYLPEDSETRKSRKDALYRVIKNMREITPNTIIYINAQNYRDEDYLNEDGIVYLFKHEKGIGAQNARNELLKWFYNSDYEYMLLSDDDAFLAPTNSAKLFYKELEEHVERFIKNKVDVCYTRNIQYMPFNENDVLDIEKRESAWQLLHCPSHWLYWAAIRNLKKAYNDEVYQDPKIKPEETLGYDDTDFSFDLCAKGYYSWRMPMLQALPFCAGEDKSSIFKDMKNPLYRARNIDITRKKYLGERMPNGFYDYSKLKPKKQKMELLIPRGTAVDSMDDEFYGRGADILLKRVREKYE